MAEALQIGVGDILTFSVGSTVIEAPITNIRTVFWENFKPNFYVIANQQLIENLPQTWLLSALIEESQKPDGWVDRQCGPI